MVAGPSPATSYSGIKVSDQRLGAVFTTPAQSAEIVAASPCQTPTVQSSIVYPNYVLECSDPLGIQIMATGTFTRFTFTTTSQGAGCIDFQFFLEGAFVSNQFVVLGVDSNLITPLQGLMKSDMCSNVVQLLLQLIVALPQVLFNIQTPTVFTTHQVRQLSLH